MLVFPRSIRRAGEGEPAQRRSLLHYESFTCKQFRLKHSSLCIDQAAQISVGAVIECKMLRCVCECFRVWRVFESGHQDHESCRFRIRFVTIPTDYLRQGFDLFGFVLVAQVGPLSLLGSWARTIT